MAKKRPNPADFRFENKSEESLIREPGQISPYDFSIDTLDKCVVHLLDKIAQITVDRATNSRLHFGPTEGSIFLRDCENCVVTASCAQFRLKNCKRLWIFLYCNSDPAIEYSSELVFGPYNFAYPLQDTHFAAAKLNPSNDKWSQVFDFNKTDEEHWRLMKPEEFKLMQWENEELGQPVNPVPRHTCYGGTLDHDIKVGSQQHGEQGLMSFTFDTNQNEAEELAYKEPEVKKPEYVIEEDIGFGDAPVSVTFSAYNSDPFGEPVSDPFAAPPAEQYKQPEVDSEELERQRLRDQENKDRNKKMMNKDEKERLKKDEKRQQAREELKKWHADRNKQASRKKDLNQEAEKLLLEKRKTFPTSWKKVASMIEGEDRKDVARMKSVLLAKKHEN